MLYFGLFSLRGINIHSVTRSWIFGPRRVPESLTTVTEPETQPKMTYNEECLEWSSVSHWYPIYPIRKYGRYKAVFCLVWLQNALCSFVCVIETWRKVLGSELHAPCQPLCGQCCTRYGAVKSSPILAENWESIQSPGPAIDYIRRESAQVRWELRAVLEILSDYCVPTYYRHRSSTKKTT